MRDQAPGLLLGMGDQGLIVELENAAREHLQPVRHEPLERQAISPELGQIVAPGMALHEQSLITGQAHIPQVTTAEDDCRVGEREVDGSDPLEVAVRPK